MSAVTQIVKAWSREMRHDGGHGGGCAPGAGPPGTVARRVRIEHEWAMVLLRSLLPILAAALLLPAPSLGQADAIDDVAEAHISTLSPGVAVALHHGGEITFLDTWGVLRHGGDEPLAPGTPFAAPDLTPFMVEAVLRALHDAGRIDMDQPLGLLLPDLTTPLADATLRQLVTHTAGLDDAELREEWSRETLLDQVRGNWFFTDPGSVISTSRYSLPVAARVLELITRQALPDLLDAVLLQPLGMQRSTFDPDEARDLGLAPGFRPTDRPDSPVAEVEVEGEVALLPVLFTTIHDIALLLGAWADGNIRGSSPLDRPEIDVPGPPGLDRRTHGFSWTAFRGTERLRMASGRPGGAVSVDILPAAGAVAVAWSAGRAPTRPTTFIVERIADAAGLPPSAVSGGGGPAASGPDEGDPGRGLLSEDDLPRLAGTWLNGDRKIELRRSEGGLTFFDGRSELTVGLEGERRLVVRIADGRPALALEVVHDREGRAYLYLGNRAFRRQDPPG